MNLKNQMSESPNRSAINRVYHQLRQLIIRGEFAPGEKLKIETLKSLFDIGASPIREALSLLTSNKLVERIDQRGFRVSTVSEANFNEIFMLRCTLDELALRKSMELGDDAWEEGLVLAHHRLMRASSDDSDNWESLHKQFHIQLLVACDSPILMSYCHQLYDQNIRYRFLAGKNSSYAVRDVRHEHEAILTATLNRDVDQASQLLIQHYTYTGNYLRRGVVDGEALTHK